MRMLYSFYKKRRERLEQKLEAAKEREQKALEREMKSDRERRENLKGVPGHFAHGLNFYKYFWIFFLCCFLGVVIETVFVLVTTGRLMQRTGLVWGPFNLIYGIGAVLLTACLHRFVNRDDRWLFFGGAVLGGAFEYFCSWLQETVTGTVSWDYSNFPLNINGRTNVLYCLFWGILALVWIKELYPRLNGWIERSVSNRYGAAITWVLAVFMLVNSLVSGAAVMRWQQRYQGIPAAQSWQTAMDQAYPDDVLSKIYPSMTRTQSKV